MITYLRVNEIVSKLRFNVLLFYNRRAHLDKLGVHPDDEVLKLSQRIFTLVTYISKNMALGKKNYHALLSLQG